MEFGNTKNDVLGNTRIPKYIPNVTHAQTLKEIVTDRQSKKNVSKRTALKTFFVYICWRAFHFSL